MKRSKILALLLMLLVSIAVNAQNVTASGIVKDGLSHYSWGFNNYAYNFITL